MLYRASLLLDISFSNLKKPQKSLLSFNLNFRPGPAVNDTWFGSEWHLDRQWMTPGPTVNDTFCKNYCRQVVVFYFNFMISRVDCRTKISTSASFHGQTKFDWTFYQPDTSLFLLSYSQRSYHKFPPLCREQNVRNGHDVWFVNLHS